MKWYSWILIFLFIMLQGQLWFSSGGVFDLIKIKKQLVRLDQKLLTIHKKNNVLEADIEDLRRGNESIEERAREVLGMKKTHETFYWVVPDKRLN